MFKSGSVRVGGIHVLQTPALVGKGENYKVCAVPLRKRIFGHVRTAKAQISLRIRAVWLGILPTLTES